jgi:hypothetical protein
MTMRILTLCAVFSIAASVTVPAQSQAVVREISGKVEVMPAGQSWIPARVGMSLALGTFISTGFNSSAVLEIGQATLQARPLTRLRLDELVEREGTIRTDLFLKVGKVRAQVKTGEGLTQDFKLKSPVSTAAVRGTGFEYEGYDLYVFEGNVRYSSLVGQERTYSPGEEGSTSGYDTPSDGESGWQAGSEVIPYTPGAGGQAGGGLGTDPEAGQTGTVIIVIPPRPE